MARRRNPRKMLNARNADRHALYEIAVQQPEVMIGFIEELFARVRDREPELLREDFCGTGLLSSMWVMSAPGRRAIGVDTDAEVLRWARSRNHVDGLTLIKNDVTRVGKTADAVVALNFSSWIYKQRHDMLAYLRHARRCVRPGGLFLCDAFGGPAPGSDRRKFKDFDYLWEQRSFNPLTSEIDCRIHFRFRDGSIMRDAFVYDWRMWTLMELRELLAEAGFGPVGIYFESEEGFLADFDQVNPDAWVAYVVALRD